MQTDADRPLPLDQTELANTIGNAVAEALFRAGFTTATSGAGSAAEELKEQIRRATEVHFLVDTRSEPHKDDHRPDSAIAREAHLPRGTLSPFLTRRQAAKWLNVSIRFLERAATLGNGPRFRRHGGRVVYALEDLIAWSDAQVRTSTSDSGRAV